MYPSEGPQHRVQSAGFIRTAEVTLISIQPGKDRFRRLEEMGGVQCDHSEPSWILHGVWNPQSVQMLFDAVVVGFLRRSQGTLKLCDH